MFIKTLNFVFKGLVSRKTFIFYFLIVFIFCIGGAFINFKQSSNGVMDRKVVFHAQSIDTNSIRKRLLVDGASYYIFQNTVKRGGSIINSREVYDLVGYIYKANDTSIVKLDRVNSGPHEFKYRTEEDINVSAYRMSPTKLARVLKKHNTASALIFRPHASSYKNHVDYIAYPNDITPSIFSVTDIIQLQNGTYNDKKFGRLKIDEDYLYLNPSPPRNSLQDQ